MKQPNLAEKIITMSIEGILIGISSTIRTLIDLIIHLLSGTSTFADCGQSNNVSLQLVGTADFDNSLLISREVTNERESNETILFSNGKVGFTEAKGSPLFGGLLPHDISILCRYWCSNKFDCVIVL